MYTVHIESMNDLKEAMFKYASNKGYWRSEIKLSFNLATTTATFKARPILQYVYCISPKWMGR